MNKHRNQILVGILAAVLLVWGGDWLRGRMSATLEGYHKKTTKLQEDIENRERDIEKMRKAAKELEELRKQSLPTNAEVARSLYRGWLLELVGRAGFLNPNVDSSEPVNRKGIFQLLSFSMRGRGTLPQLTRFLFEFYSADHLHQIKSLTVSPVAAADQLELLISIEAVVLPIADRKDRLNTQRSDRLASEKLDDYQVIVERNLFGVGNSSSDPSTYTRLTSVNYINGQPEVWFNVRTTDTLLKLRKGDVLEVGQFKGVVAEIDDADVVLESDGERWLLTIGEGLTQATALPPER